MSARKNRIQPPVWPADTVVRRPLAELVPAARNARTHTDEQIDQIAASIQEWGWTIPVLVDEAGVLIAGHARVLAAVRLGIATVPTMVATGWSEAQRRAYLIADNQLAQNSAWDSELLAMEIKELSGAGFALSLTGLSEEELGLLLEPVPELSGPGAFTEYDETIPTEHQCPSCGFRWSGKSAPASELAPDGALPGPDGSPEPGEDE
jgi:hypothetical protein